MPLNIHQKINARTWYDGEIHPRAEKRIVVHGHEVHVPERLRIATPYQYIGCVTDRPKPTGWFLQPVPDKKCVQFVLRKLNPVEFWNMVYEV